MDTPAPDPTDPTDDRPAVPPAPDLAERVEVAHWPDVDAEAAHSVNRAAAAADVLSSVQAAMLPWARWPWNRCAARTERRERCDLQRHGVELPHALEHGMDTPRWSTRWTDDAGLDALRDRFSVGQRYGYHVELPPGAHRDEPVLEHLLLEASDAFAQACLDAGVDVGPTTVQVVTENARLFERNVAVIRIEAPIERVASWAQQWRPAR